MRRREFLHAAAVGGVSATFASRGVARKTYEPLGSIAIENAKEAVVGPDGTTVYVAATDGFATVDVSDPANPTRLAERRDLLSNHEHGPLTQIWDAKVASDRLVVAGPANPIDSKGVHGILLYDVSDPAAPERVGFHETDVPIHNLDLKDGVAYLTGNDGDANPLLMVDVTGDDLQEVGRWSMVDYDSAWSNVDAWVRTLHDLWVQDGVAYLAQWDAGTWVVDVSDPASPGHVAHFGGRPLDELADIPSGKTNEAVVGRPGNHHYVMANDDASLLGVGKEAWDANPDDDSGGPAGVELWDVSTPAKPRKLSTIAPPATPNPSYALGGLDAGVADSVGSLGLAAGVGAAGVGAAGVGGGVAHRGCHDCSGGGSSSSGVWTTAHNFDLVGDRLFTSWYQGGVKIHDVSDPANPRQLAWWRKPGEASFWTAKRANEKFFVASSMGGEGNDRGRLYTFPNRPGEQSNPPSLVGNGSSNGSEPSVPQQATSTRGDGTNETDDATLSAEQAGFGVLAGVASVGLGTWAHLRGRGDGD